MPTTRNLATLIFEDVKVLDLGGPFEVFSVASRFTDPPAFHGFTVAEQPGPVLTRGGLSVNPHHRLADCPRPDLLLVPGGQGTRREMHNPALTGWIKARSQEAELLPSVCTGALLLAKAGLLDGLEATTHHGAIDLWRQTAPSATVHADRRFVDNGRVVCSAGTAAGIDMGLHVVTRLLGEAVASKTARQMEYPFPMRRTKAGDCRTLPFNVAQVYAALLAFESYPRWWPAQLRVRVLKVAPDGAGSRVEVRPRGGRFICEVGQVIPDREILIEYVEGVHRGTGRWTFEKLAEGSRACYRIDLEPQGWLPRLLSNWMNFGKMHSRSMAKVFDGLATWLERER
jgi:putative intracellular protease/amidase/ribosome-associated toxin RatA of RatAB toxin-antitoxin module